MKTILLSLLLVAVLGPVLNGCGSSTPEAGPATAPTPPSKDTSAAAHMSPEAQAAKNAAGGK